MTEPKKSHFIPAISNLLHKLVLFSVRGTTNGHEYQDARIIPLFLEAGYHKNALENILFHLKKSIFRLEFYY